jgi:hypothetical protein
MREIILLAAIIISGNLVNAQQTPDPSPDTTLQEYAGKYKFPDGSVVTEVTVMYENGVLSANSSAGNSELRKIAVDTFEVVAFNGTANFRRGTDKKITGVQILVNETNLEGTREEDAFAGMLPERFLAFRN